MNTHAVASAAAAPIIRAAEWKQRLTAERAELETRFQASPVASELLTKLRLLVDRHLRDAWSACDLPRDLALVAVGGYGRGELYP